MAASISDLLLDWYDTHARKLPWRAGPRDPRPDPYRVWLSEVMLQQTTVAAVKPYFAAFTARWPTVEALAAAEEADVMAAWAGLGYYSRARNLARAARAVAARGGFPGTEVELRALPGLGAYTAAAVAAIAFGRRAVVVDTNVERVLARLFAIAEPLPAARKSIRMRAEQITPDERPGDFAQAMMDLGATICVPREPRCLLCPLSAVCVGRRSGAPARFPVKPAKKVRPMRRGKAYWIERDGAVWLVRRAGRGMLGGMRALPDDGWGVTGDGTDGFSGEALGVVRHGFTHFDLELSVERLDEPLGEGEWWQLEKLDEAGLPTLFAKAARFAIG